jgi:hypothetical protein
MKAPKFDIRKSIEQLEKIVWDDNDLPTALVEKVHRYRKIPVCDLSIEQMRLLIGQNVGLSYIIPQAIIKLRENIFAEGDMYEGDLLAAVLTSEIAFWNENPGLKQEMEQVLTLHKKEIEESIAGNKNRKLPRLIETFKGSAPDNP